MKKLGIILCTVVKSQIRLTALGDTNDNYNRHYTDFCNDIRASQTDI